MPICPFCNSQIDAIANRAHPVCPRCDAALAENVVAGLPPAGSASAAPVVPMPFAPGKKKTIVTILSVMALMAALATGYSLWTKDFRRGNDRKKGFVPSEPVSSAPVETALVGFIPERCHVIGAVNLNDLRANAVAKKAIFDKMPRSVEWVNEKLNAATGLTLDDLAQAAAGVEVVEAEGLVNNFKIYVVVQTKKEYDPEAILKAFGRQKKEMLRKRPFVRFPLPYVGQGVAWAQANDRVAFLFSLDERPVNDLEAIPDRPRQNLEGSSETLKALVKERVDKQSLAWAACEMRAFGDVLGAVGARTEPFRPLLEAKAITVSVKTDSDAVVLVNVLSKSAKQAEAVEEWFKAVDWRGESSKKVLPPQEGGEPWVTMQLRYRPEAIGRLLSEGPGLKK